MKKKADLIVFGGGIGALSFLYELALLELLPENLKKLKEIKILLIHAPLLATPCSFHTTSTVSLTGIQPGVSPLGDLLFKSFHHFEHRFTPLIQSIPVSELGIELVTKEYFFRNEEEKKDSPILVGSDANDGNERFKNLHEVYQNYIKDPYKKDFKTINEENSYVIYPEIFQRFLLQSAMKKLTIEVVEDFITKVECLDGDFLLKSQCGEYSAPKLLDARGAYQNEFQSFFPQHFGDSFVKDYNLTTVRGSFLRAKGPFLSAGFEKSFYRVFNDLNFIYRHHTQELIIGSTTLRGAIVFEERSLLKIYYDEIVKLVDLEIPRFEQFEVVTGLRTKAKKRTPLLKHYSNFQNLKTELWHFSGLYKNAYTTSFFLAFEELKTEVKQEILVTR